MLNKDALSQLNQLKSTIVAQKEYAEGVVRATAKRFGFVRLNDGRDAFINPEQMLRVLPGDKVKVSLSTNSKKQLEAQLEQLLESHLTTFVGRYLRKGKTHFVEPDLAPFNRWLFIPPDERTNCTEDDLVECQLIRHPFKHQGKAQVRVINRLGRPDDIGIEGRYIAAKFTLPTDWEPAALEQAQEIASESLALSDNRQDLTHIPFITIDSEFTRDMDDAIYAQQTDNGWQLITAIADPSAYIELNSALELSARERASTLYLLGHSITMLPTELSHDTFSLRPEQLRPAIVCQMHISAEGELTHYQFNEAVIRSQQKLNYNNVSSLLCEDDSDNLKQTLPRDILDSLFNLNQCASARLAYRKQHALVMEDRADYQYWLNDAKKIERIEKRQRNIAQKIVEEAMLATNISAGQFFQQHPDSGLYSTHIGFRPERLDDAKQRIGEVLPEVAEQNFSQLDNFQKLFRHLRENPEQLASIKGLLALLQRMQQAGSLSAEPLAHFGLGFKNYATITSPIRRYQDLFNHYALKALLNNTAIAVRASDIAAPTQAKLIRARQASRQLEQWLLCQYLADKIGTVHAGSIVSVSPKGVGVKLEDIGIEGFVLLSEKNQPRPKFDSGRLTLTTDTAQYKLDETLAVKITAVDINARRISLEQVDTHILERLNAFS